MLGLSIVAGIIAVVMIVLGWKDEKITVKFEFEVRDIEMYNMKKDNANLSSANLGKPQDPVSQP